MFDKTNWKGRSYFFSLSPSMYEYLYPVLRYCESAGWTRFVLLCDFGIVYKFEFGICHIHRTQPVGPFKYTVSTTDNG